MKLDIVKDLATSRLIATARALKATDALPTDSARSFVNTTTAIRYAALTHHSAFILATLEEVEADVDHIEEYNSTTPSKILTEAVKVCRTQIKRIRQDISLGN